MAGKSQKVSFGDYEDKPLILKQQSGLQANECSAYILLWPVRPSVR